MQQDAFARSTALKERVTAWMVTHAPEHRDACGEPNATGLAEAAAARFEIDDDGGPLDDDTHWLWTVAVEAFNRYSGPRCAVCNEPATCRQLMRARNGYDATERCDDCCAHRPVDGRDVCTALPEADAARTAQGQL